MISRTFGDRLRFTIVGVILGLPAGIANSYEPGILAESHPPGLQVVQGGNDKTEVQGSSSQNESVFRAVLPRLKRGLVRASAYFCDDLVDFAGLRPAS